MSIVSPLLVLVEHNLFLVLILRPLVVAVNGEDVWRLSLFRPIKILHNSLGCLVRTFNGVDSGSDLSIW